VKHDAGGGIGCSDGGVLNHGALLIDNLADNRAGRNTLGKNAGCTAQQQTQGEKSD
jgi:hypothetical protein